MLLLALCSGHKVEAHISIVSVQVISYYKQTSNASQSTRLAARFKSSTWCVGQWRLSKSAAVIRARWNFPCIIKKGLVCSLRSWEVPLVNPTKVLWPRTPKDEGHRRGSANPPLILPAPLYRYTLSPLTTSRSNLCRFWRVKQVSDPSAGPQLPTSSSVLTSLVTDRGLSGEFSLLYPDKNHGIKRQRCTCS